MKRGGSRAVIMLLCSSILGAVEIGLAPLVIVGRDGEVSSDSRGSALTMRLIGAVKQLDIKDSLVLLPGDVPPEGEPVISILDASAFAVYNGFDALIYGRFSYSEFSIDAVIRFFDPLSGRITTTLYGRDSPDYEERLLGDMAAKLHEYFTVVLGIAPILPRRIPRKALWDYRIAPGYWMPLGAWQEVLSGIVSMETALNLTPVHPVWERGPWLMIMRFGFSALYSLGISRPDAEGFLHNAVRLGIPFDIAFDYREEHRLAVGIQPTITLDILTLQRKYRSELWTGISAVMGMAVNLTYRFSWNGRSGIGVQAETAFIFYSPLRFELRPFIFYEYRFPKKSERGASGRKA